MDLSKGLNKADLFQITDSDFTLDPKLGTECDKNRNENKLKVTKPCTDLIP